jgi:hypothetical protein
VILGTASVVASVFWLAWAVFSGWGFAAFTVGLLVIYGGVVVGAIRMAGSSTRVTMELVVLSVAALIGTWMLGAAVALMFWGEPIGPPN